MAHLLQKKQPTGENIFHMKVAIFVELRIEVPIDANMRNMYAKCNLINNRGPKKNIKTVEGLKAQNIIVRRKRLPVFQTA